MSASYAANDIGGGARTVDQFVGRGGGPLERQKQDSHVYRKTGTLPPIFRENQSRHCLNDEV